MMDNFRLILFISLGVILMLLWQAWEQHNAPARAPNNAVSTPATPAGVPSAPADSSRAGPGVPAAPATPAPAGTPVAVPLIERATRIRVQTDVMVVEIDTAGGDLRVLDLPRYPVSVDKPKQPLRLLSDDDAAFHIAQSGLIGSPEGLPYHKTRFASARTDYMLAEGQRELRVPLTHRAKDGTRYTKTYVFRRNDYTVDVEFHVDNATRREWRGYFYGQFARRATEAPGMFALPTYSGAAIYTANDKYQKISFEDMAKNPLKRENTGGWVAMLQHYFVGAWMPAAKARSEFYSDSIGSGRYTIGYKQLEPTAIAPGRSGTLTGQLYLGPKEPKRLAKLVEGMDLTVDYGWLTVISAPLYWALDWIHRFLGNWGWAIIVLTILIKAAFYPLSAASYKSMAQMKKLAPRLKALKERYGDDKQKLNQAMMEMYKTEKINPLGGCLPILIQIPVFIALYWVLLESVELRHAPWALWIKDLSGKDPYYVLPIIMGITMYAQQLLNPQPLDPMQKRIFMVMPGLFTVLFLFFPAGLVLYWTVNNLLSIAQQWAINRTLGVTH